MTVVEMLDQLRQSSPGCSLVAFGDLRTRLMLRTSSETSRPQERLDALCNQAAGCFAVADSDAIAALGGPVRHDAAILLTPDDARVFVRSETDETDVLCCICNAPAQTGKLIDSAKLAMLEV